jgi:hypothetical protein
MTLGWGGGGVVAGDDVRVEAGDGALVPAIAAGRPVDAVALGGETLAFDFVLAERNSNPMPTHSTIATARTSTVARLGRGMPELPPESLSGFSQ